MTRQRIVPLPTEEVEAILYSTILVQSADPKATTDEPRPLRAFHYCLGQNLPGVARAVPASRLETNLHVANCLVDDLMFIKYIEWSIPFKALAVYQPNQTEYKVTAEDIREFVAKAHLSFYAGGDRPIGELPPAAARIEIDEAEGVWCQPIVDFNKPWELRRLEKFWAEINWPRGEPTFGNGATIPVKITMYGVARRGLV